MHVLIEHVVFTSVPYLSKYNAQTRIPNLRFSAALSADAALVEMDTESIWKSLQPGSPALQHYLLDEAVQFGFTLVCHA